MENPESSPKKRPVEKIISDLFGRLNQDFVVVGRTRVTTWHAWLLIGLAAGIAAGIILVANNSGEFGKSRAAAFAANDRVTASQKISVQSKAGGGKTLGAVDAGDAGSITAGPTVVLKKNWWKVKWDKGLEGWSQEGYLKKSATPSPANPSSSTPANCASNSPTCTITFPNVGIFPVSVTVTSGKTVVASTLVTVGGGGGGGGIDTNCHNPDVVNDTRGGPVLFNGGGHEYCSFGLGLWCNVPGHSGQPAGTRQVDQGYHILSPSMGDLYCDWQGSSNWSGTIQSIKIQGYKVKMPGNENVTPPGGETVTLDGGSPKTGNPYVFVNISPSPHTVAVTAPSGWNVGYTLCMNNGNCHNDSPTPGNSVSVNVPTNQYADLWWHYSPPANQPKGSHDSSNATASSGWACDSDDYNQSLTIHFYKDGPAGSGTFLGATTASQAREQAVGDLCGGNSNHGFSYPSPDSLKDGNSHTVYAYALNIGPTANNPLLSGSPKQISGVNCAQNYTGTHNTVGLPNGDTRFLCFQSRWYDCGWEQNDPNWETKATNGQRVGDWTCNLPASQWTKPNSAQFISQNVPSTMTAGQSYPVSITLKNTGTNAWNTTDYHLGSQNPQDNNKFQHGRAILPNAVAPGATVTINFNAKAPAATGTYNFQMRMVQENVEWFGDFTQNVAVAVTVNTGDCIQNYTGKNNEVGIPNGDTRFLCFQSRWYDCGWEQNDPNWETKATNGQHVGGWTCNLPVAQWTKPNAAQFISQNVPAAMIAGQSYPVSITLKNTGANAWNTTDYHLGSQNPQDNNAFQHGRAILPNAVAPGATVTTNFNAKAPSTPGTYNFQMRMVQENVEWFGDFTQNVAVTVTVN